MMQKLQRNSEDIIIVTRREEELFRNTFTVCALRLRNTLETECTICSKVIGDDVSAHPALCVALCTDCLNHYEKTVFKSYKNGDDLQCRWCAKSSLNYNCTKCTCLFCEDCVLRNLGANHGIDWKTWSCFICDPKPLWRLRAFCYHAIHIAGNNNTMMNASQSSSEAETINSSDPDAEDFLAKIKNDFDIINRRFVEQFNILYERRLKPDKLYDFQNSYMKFQKFYRTAISNLIRVKNLNESRYLSKYPKQLITDEIEVDHLLNEFERKFNQVDKDETTPPVYELNQISFKRKLDKKFTLSLRSAKIPKIEVTDESEGFEKIERKSPVESGDEETNQAESDNCSAQTDEILCEKTGTFMNPESYPYYLCEQTGQMIYDEEYPSGTEPEDLTDIFTQLDHLNESIENDVSIKDELDIEETCIQTERYLDELHRIKTEEHLKIEEHIKMEDDDRNLNAEEEMIEMEEESKFQIKTEHHSSSDDSTDAEERQLVLDKLNQSSDEVFDVTSSSSEDDALLSSDYSSVSDEEQSDDVPKAIKQIIKSDPKLSNCTISLSRISSEDKQINRLLNMKSLEKLSKSSDSVKRMKKNKYKSSSSSSSSSSDSSDSDSTKLGKSRSNTPDDLRSSDRLSDFGLSDLSSVEFKSPSSHSSDTDELSDNLLAPKKQNKTQITESKKPSEKNHDPNSKWKNDSLLRQRISDSDSDSNSSDCDKIPKIITPTKDKKISKPILESEDSDCFIIGKIEKKVLEKYIDSSDTDASVQFVNEDLIENENIITTPGTPKRKGRQNIRDVLPDELLTEQTQLADKEESERQRRILSNREELNLILSQSELLNEKDSLVLDIDKEEKLPLLVVDAALVSPLKSHQRAGIKFMWDICFESITEIQCSKGAGCILAHCMGLGKTMQVVVLTHTLLVNPATNVKHILVLCPLSTVYNWHNEFTNTLKDVKEKIRMYFITSDKCKTFKTKSVQVRNWKRNGGVMIMGYDTFVTLVDTDKKRKFPSDVEMPRALLKPGPDLVVCDEGHILKSGKTNLFKCLTKIETKRRIILTGTPMQNNLKEYYYMVNFVKPNLLGTYKEYTRRFLNPIMNGQYEDSNRSDIKLMRYRSHVLHKTLEMTVQRYEVSELTPYLPKIHDMVIFSLLSPTQINLYKAYLGCIERDKKMLFQNYYTLQNIWMHPAVLQIKHEQKSKYQTDADNHWFSDLIPPDVTTQIEYGPKMKILFAIIKECELIREKLLIFSSTYIEMDLIERFLNARSTLEGHQWKNKVNYLRMDGRVETDVRLNYCDTFNNRDNIKLFIISHKVGGLGLNLTAANRVVLLNVNWNPAVDLQSVFRVYRFGQMKECYVYRLVSLGTMEETVYQKAVTKLAISCRVVDEQQISRHFKSDDMQRMYTLNEDFPKQRPTLNPPSDRLLAKLWCELDPILYKYVDHISLLENLEDEVLDEMEMKLAWDEFRNDEQIAKDLETRFRQPMYLNGQPGWSGPDPIVYNNVQPSTSQMAPLLNTAMIQPNQINHISNRLNPMTQIPSHYQHPVQTPTRRALILQQAANAPPRTRPFLRPNPLPPTQFRQVANNNNNSSANGGLNYINRGPNQNQTAYFVHNELPITIDDHDQVKSIMKTVESPQGQLPVLHIVDHQDLGNNYNNNH